MNRSKLILNSFLTLFPEHVAKIREIISNAEKTRQSTSFNESFTPKDEDFVRVPFRLLSAHIVGAYTWKATDFSDEAVLKDSIHLIIGKPAYVNHDIYDVNNAIGVIESAEWQDSSVDEMGNNVPAGIIGTYKIDAVSNFDLARALLSEPPAIQGSSVSIDYEYVPSHEFPEEWQFEYNVGKMVDGRMVCRKVTKILDYIESSLVGVPADPLAKILKKDKMPMNPSRGRMVANFSEEDDIAKQAFFSEKAYFVSDSGQTDFVELQSQKKINESLNEKIKFLEKQLQDSNAVAETIQVQYKAIKIQNQEFQTKNIELQGRIAEMQTLFEFGTKVLATKRAEVLKAYNLTVKEPNEQMLKTIETASIEQLEGLMDTFLVKLVDDLEPHCEDCKGKNISYRSSEPTQTKGQTTESKKSNLTKIFRK